MHASGWLEFILTPHLLHQFERMFIIPWRFISFSARITRSSSNSSDEIIFSLQWTPNPVVLISSVRSFINMELWGWEDAALHAWPHFESQTSPLLTLTALSTFSYNDLGRGHLYQIYVHFCVKCFAKINAASKSILALFPGLQSQLTAMEGRVKLLRRMTSGRCLGAWHFQSVQKNAAVARLQLALKPVSNR